MELHAVRAGGIESSRVVYWHHRDTVRNLLTCRVVLVHVTGLCTAENIVKGGEVSLYPPSCGAGQPGQATAAVTTGCATFDTT